MPTQISFLTALGPSDPDDGEADATLCRCSHSENRLGYQVPSQSGNGSYVVSVDDEPFCTCPDFEKHQQPCKHIYAVEFIIQREERPDGTTVETKAVRVTYSQDWPAYNAARFTKGTTSPGCSGNCAIPCPSRLRPLDAHAAPRRYAVCRWPQVYSTMSGRRAMADFFNAQDSSLFDKMPSFAITFRYMEDPALAPC